MQSIEKRFSIGHFLVLTGLWVINILILVFGFPFLVFKKIQEVFFKTTKNNRLEAKQSSKSARYFPRQVDSKL